jgi:hypothetical protein
MVKSSLYGRAGRLTALLGGFRPGQWRMRRRCRGQSTRWPGGLHGVPRRWCERDGDRSLLRQRRLRHAVWPTLGCVEPRATGLRRIRSSSSVSSYLLCSRALADARCPAGLVVAEQLARPPQQWQQQPDLRPHTLRHMPLQPTQLRISGYLEKWSEKGHGSRKSRW